MLGLVAWCWAPDALAAPLQSSDPDEVTSSLPPGIDIKFEGQARVTEDGEYVFTGPVTIVWRNSRLQADRLSMREERYIEAEGNVLVVWEGNRIYGTRMAYDLHTESGVFENAIGHVKGDYLFWAESAEKVGDKTVRVKTATVTTCTQPAPYWSFAVSTATITVDKYAHMWNVRLKSSNVPFFYMPYLVWPVKKDRAAGLLFPEFQNTEQRGRAFSQELFVPLGPSADVTLLARYYTEAGLGGGGELRFLPNQNGAATFNGFYIDDKVTDSGRYRATYKQTQQFRNGFRMVADINLVSDFDYFADFERDLELVSSPTILARVEFSRNGAWTSLNARDQRREQLFSDGTELVQSTLPEIEFRGRSRRIGRTPFYFEFQSSAASISQHGNQTGRPIDADYLRGDFFTTVSMPLSSIPWLQATPLVRYRFTRWTQHQEQISNPITGATSTHVVDDPLTRTLWGAGLDIIGPKFQRIFDGGGREGAIRYKNLIEPRVVYGFQEEDLERDRIILFDEVDRFSGAGNQIAYSLTSRLFVQRPRARLQSGEPRTMDDLLQSATSTSQVLTADSDEEQFLPEAAPLEYDTSAGSEPVEIASVEVRQQRSFDTDLSFADLDGDGINDAASSTSDIQLVGRYNPSPLVSLDLRSNYHVLYNRVSSVNFSGSVSNALARLRFSVFRRNGLGVQNTGTGFEPIPDDTQLRLTTGINMFSGRLRLDLDGSIDFDPQPGQRTVPDRRIRLTWASQCCTIMVEQLVRTFPGAPDRDDLYFRVDLTGIGKIFDVSY